MLKWLGDLFLLLDMYLVGRKSRLAWVFCIVGEVCWIVWATKQQNWALVLICVAFTILGACNLYKWSRPNPLEPPANDYKTAYKIIKDWCDDNSGSALEQRNRLVVSIAKAIHEARS